MASQNKNISAALKNVKLGKATVAINLIKEYGLIFDGKNASQLVTTCYWTLEGDKLKAEDVLALFQCCNIESVWGEHCSSVLVSMYHILKLIIEQKNFEVLVGIGQSFLKPLGKQLETDNDKNTYSKICMLIMQYAQTMPIETKSFMEVSFLVHQMSIATEEEWKIVKSSIKHLIAQKCDFNVLVDYFMKFLMTLKCVDSSTLPEALVTLEVVLTYAFSSNAKNEVINGAFIEILDKVCIDNEMASSLKFVVSLCGSFTKSDCHMIKTGLVKFDKFSNAINTFVISLMYCAIGACKWETDAETFELMLDFIMKLTDGYKASYECCCDLKYTIQPDFQASILILHFMKLTVQGDAIIPSGCLKKVVSFLQTTWSMFQLLKSKKCKRFEKYWSAFNSYTYNLLAAIYSKNHSNALTLIDLAVQYALELKGLDEKYAATYLEISILMRTSEQDVVETLALTGLLIYLYPKKLHNIYPYMYPYTTDKFLVDAMNESKTFLKNYYKNFKVLTGVERVKLLDLEAQALLKMRSRKIALVLRELCALKESNIVAKVLLDIEISTLDGKVLIDCESYVGRLDCDASVAKFYYLLYKSELHSYRVSVSKTEIENDKCVISDRIAGYIDLAADRLLKSRKVELVEIAMYLANVYKLNYCNSRCLQMWHAVLEMYEHIGNNQMIITAIAEIIGQELNEKIIVKGERMLKAQRPIDHLIQFKFHYNLCLCYFTNGKFDKSIEHFEIVTQNYCSLENCEGAEIAFVKVQFLYLESKLLNCGSCQFAFNKHSDQGPVSAYSAYNMITKLLVDADKTEPQMYTLMFEIAEQVLHQYEWLRMPKYIRFYARNALHYARNFAAPLRACKILCYLARSDIFSWRLDDFSQKMECIAAMLKYDCRNIELPQFLTHKASCSCSPCAHVEHQELLLKYIHLSAIAASNKKELFKLLQDTYEKLSTKELLKETYLHFFLDYTHDEITENTSPNLTKMIQAARDSHLKSELLLLKQQLESQNDFERRTYESVITTVDDDRPLLQKPITPIIKTQPTISTPLFEFFLTRPKTCRKKVKSASTPVSSSVRRKQVPQSEPKIVHLSKEAAIRASSRRLNFANSDELTSPVLNLQIKPRSHNNGDTDKPKIVEPVRRLRSRLRE